jgi:hypothetical protein
MSIIKKLRTRITSAHVIAMIALFVALSGSSYAAVTIRASQIRNNSIPGSKLKTGSIPATKLRNNSITGGKLKNNSVGAAKLRTDALTPTSGGGNLINANSEDSGNSSSGTLRGPQGPGGPRGLTGATGPAGATGSQGAAGAAGTNADLVKVTGGAVVPTDGTEATATATCAPGSVLFSVYYATAATTALAVNATNTYSVTITAAPGVRVDVFGLCAPGA